MASNTSSPDVSAARYNTVKVGDVDIFYREAGDKDSPAILLLHGFPTSSNRSRNIIVPLATSLRVIAPGCPGYGFSSMPDHEHFSYNFENLALVMDAFTAKMGLEKYIVYLMDYGAPIGLRMALNKPHKIAGLIVQNGNPHDDGLREFWNPMKKYWGDPSPETFKALFLSDPGAAKWQYTNGVADPTLLDPTTWVLDQVDLDRPGNAEIQLDRLYDYRTNLPLYPAFQVFFREYQPPTLIV